MNKSIKNTLVTILLTSTIGLAGCEKKEQPVRESAYWIGPQLTHYQDNRGDGKIDRVKETYISKFFAAQRWHYRSPTKQELRDSEKILASENIFAKQ